MFVRSWLRAVLGAGGTVLVVPVGLVLAVALAAAVGGSSLGGLGQLLEGPQVPGVATAAAGSVGGTTGGEVPAVPVRARPTTTSRGRTSTATAPGTGRPVRTGGPVARAPGAAADARRRPRASGPVGRAPRRPARPGAGAPATPAPQSPGAPAPSPTAPVNPVREVGGAVQDLLRPAPLGAVAADAVGTVVDLIAPPPP